MWKISVVEREIQMNFIWISCEIRVMKWKMLLGYFTFNEIKKI